MKVWHDESYLSHYGAYTRFIERGYADIDIYHLRFRFEYTEEQKEQNRAAAERLGNPSQAWAERCAATEKQRSDYMKPIMEAIAEQFTCYNYAKSGQEDWHFYGTDGWDFYFWCGEFHSFKPDIPLPITRPEDLLPCRNYGYFTLGFNKEQTAEQHFELLEQLTAFLEEHFSGMDNLDVAIQYCINFHEKDMERDGLALLDGLDGTPCHFNGMEGKVKKAPDGTPLFMKKRAKTKGYILTGKDLLGIAWDLETA